MLYDFHAFSNIHITVNMWAWTHPVPATVLQQIYRATPDADSHTYMNLTKIICITHIIVIYNFQHLVYLVYLVYFCLKSL